MCMYVEKEMRFNKVRCRKAPPNVGFGGSYVLAYKLIRLVNRVDPSGTKYQECCSPFRDEFSWKFITDWIGLSNFESDRTSTARTNEEMLSGKINKGFHSFMRKKDAERYGFWCGDTEEMRVMTVILNKYTIVAEGLTHGMSTTDRFPSVVSTELRVESKLMTSAAGNDYYFPKLTKLKRR